MTTIIPKLEGSQALAPSESQVHQTGTPPQVTSLQDIPFVGTPPVGCPFARFIVSPRQKKWDCSSSGTLSDQCNKQTHVDSQEAEVRSEHNSTKGNEDMPELALAARPSSEPQGQEPISPPSSPTRPLLILAMVQWWEPQGTLGIRTVRAMPTIVGPHLTQMHPERMWLTQIWSQAPGTVSHVWTQMR